MTNARGFLTNFGAKAGRFLSDFSYVMSTLLFYVLLSFITYVWIKLTIPQDKVGAFSIAYELATGAAPSGFAANLQGHLLLSCWILIFHVLSWLIVPVLAGTAVSGAFHAWEERRMELDRLLLGKIREVISAQKMLSSEDVEQLAQQAKTEMLEQAKRRK